MFGDSDWIPIKLQQKFLSFPFFGSQFVDNLVVNDDQNVIELVNPSEIDSVYHSDIIGAQCFVRLDGFNQTIIESEQNKKEFLDNASKFTFDKIEEILFKIPKDVKVVNIYAQPKGATSIYLLKQINL